MTTETTLVLLPGLDGTDVFFRPLLASLPATIRPHVVCYPESGPHRYEDLLKLVLGSVEALPDFYVLGLSFSGPLAVMLAAAQPGRVQGIILSATFLRFPRPDLLPWRFAVSGPVLWLLRAARRLPIWLLRKPGDAFRQAKAETWGRVSAKALASRIHEIFRVDVRELLRESRHPVLCLAFDEDDVVPKGNADEVLKEKPTAKMVTLPGRHLGIWMTPNSVAREVASFIHHRE